MKRRKHQKFRSRGGIRLPAVITLCLALSLLIFSRAGGEPIAQKALTGLAHNSGFVTRAMALEFGVSPDDTAEVYTPRTAAAARDEQAENPLAESTYVPSSGTENDNPVLSAADKAATVSINNETSYDVDAADCLAANEHLSAGGDGPQVLIYHTHGSESYTPDAAFPYTPTETERTTDTNYNVVRVGDELQKVLEDNGIEAVHIREIFDSPVYTGAYDRSLAVVEDTLEKYPSITTVIDVHRDSILTDDGRAYKTSCTINGEETAQLMLVVGTDDGGLYHPDWQENLNRAASLQYRLNRTYPTLMRPLNLRTQRFNQHATHSAFLVEVGSSGNTMTEALKGIRLFGEVLSAELTT